MSIINLKCHIIYFLLPQLSKFDTLELEKERKKKREKERKQK